MNRIADLKDPDDPKGRTYRMVNMDKKHKHRVGDLVEIIDTGVRVFVAKQSRDCDGMPLYCLTPKKDDYEQESKYLANHNWLNGYPEESLKEVM